VHRLLPESPAIVRAVLYQVACVVCAVYLLALSAASTFDPHWMHGVLVVGSLVALAVGAWVRFRGTDSDVFRSVFWTLTVLGSTLIALTITPTMLGLSLFTIAVTICASEGLRGAAAATAVCGACGTLVMWQRSPAPVPATLIFLTMLALACGTVMTLREFWRRAHAEALLLSHVDPLTELTNRRGMEIGVRRLGALAQRSGQMLGCLIIDLDSFKLINDVHGHAAGDAVLRATGRTIRESTRPADLCARIGGEEFAVFACVSATTDLAALAERVRRAIEIQESAFPVTASIGGASGGHRLPHEAWTTEGALDLLLNTADKALYRAKAAGRNLIEVV